MKNLLSTFVALFFFYFGISQSFNTLNVNQVDAVFHSDGSMFSDETQMKGGFLIRPNEDGNRPASVFNSNIWVGGRTANDEIFASRQFYWGINSSESYTPGPFNVNQLNIDFNRVWKVTGQEIRDFKNDWLDGVLDFVIPQNILDWPGKGNENITDFPDQDLAPFFDATGDGVYNPSTGDYPIIGDDLSTIIPGQMVYSVFNDNPNGSNACGVEYHTIGYAFACSEPKVLENSIFTRHIIKNEVRDYQDFYVGYWENPDLGCYQDDFIGHSEELNCFYAYNKDELDGVLWNNCTTDVEPIIGVPPVQTTKFLNKPMSSFLAYSENVGNPLPGMLKPSNIQEVFNCLTGKWKDGTPLTFGGSGYDPSSTDVVNFIYPDEPTALNGWNMFDSGLDLFEIRSIGNYQHGQFEVGDEIVIDLAHFVSSADAYSNLENVLEALEDAQEIGDFYDNGFQNDCDLIFSSLDQLDVNTFKVWPNPALDVLQIETEQEFDYYQIFNLLGKLVQVGKYEDSIDLNEFGSGLYVIKLESKDQQVSTTFIKQ